MDVGRDAAPPSLPFLVDCTALPYAKGEEREFCYSLGRWFTLDLEGGTLVCCNCGEFGGFVLWYDREGDLLQTLLAGDLPLTLLCDDAVLLCVTGITHLTSSEGAVHAFRRSGATWTPLGVVDLPCEPAGIEVEADGGLLLELESAFCPQGQGHSIRYRSGRLSPAAPVVPGDEIVQPR